MCAASFWPKPPIDVDARKTIDVADKEKLVDKRGWRCRRRRLALWPRPTAGLPQGSTHSGAKDQNTNRSRCANTEKKHRKKHEKKNTLKTSDQLKGPLPPRI